MQRDPRTGDLILFSGGHSLYARAIVWAQSCPLTHSNPEYAGYHHVAVILEPEEHGHHVIVEAVSGGVRRRRISPADNLATMTWAPVHTTEERRARVARFLQSQVGEHYNWLAIVSIGVTMLSGCDLVISRDHQVFCSQLAAECLIRAGYELPRSSLHMSPADVAALVSAPPRQLN